MAKPDTDQGWLKLAHELFAALMLADLTKAERMVLHDVLNQLYRGPVKHRTATVKPSELCHRLGCLREYAWKGLKGLVGAGILVRHEGDVFTFVKDYERWTRKGGKLAMLSPVEVERCKSMAATINQSTTMRNQVVTEPVGYVTNGLRKAEPTGYGERNQRVTVAHIGTRAIKKNKEEEEEALRCGARTRETFSEDSEPATPDDTDAQLERDHLNRARFVQAVRDSFGSLLQLEQWLVRYSHEYDDTDRAIRAVNEVKSDIRAGIKINSIGGAIRAKYQALANGNTTYRSNGTTRKPHEMDQFGELLLEKQRERTRQRELARRDSGSTAGSGGTVSGLS